MITLKLDICPEKLYESFIKKANLSKKQKHELSNDFDLRNVLVNMIKDILNARTVDKIYQKAQYNIIEDIVYKSLLKILPALKSNEEVL